VVVPRHVSPALRLRVVLHRFSLIRRLAEGADPSASPDLALCARQLSGRRERLACVDGIERVMREASSPSRGLTAQAPLQRDAIRVAQPFLINLLERLREVEQPGPQGVAQVQLLLTDGCGPLYSPSEPGTLASRAYRAAAAL
jgi:hypothetical protein